MTIHISLRAKYDERLGRTVLYDDHTGIVLFEATEALADLVLDPMELASAIAGGFFDDEIVLETDREEDETP